MLFGYFYLYLFIGWVLLCKMPEIYLLILFVIFVFLIYAAAVIRIIFLFFLFSFTISIIVGYLFSGWVARVIFLVFVGGILVIIFYLGMFRKFYSFVDSVPVVFFILVFFNSLNFIFIKVNNIGESSKYFFKFSYFFLIGGLLFSVLFLVSKIIGRGRSLRRFF